MLTKGFQEKNTSLTISAKKMYVKMRIFGFLLLISKMAIAQDDSEKFRTEALASGYITREDDKEEIVKHDIAPIFTRTVNSAIVGFIGKDYQRFRIKFISVIKNKDQQDQYFVYGKSMVKENVCEFQGTLRITNAFYLKDTEIKDARQGILIGDYSLFENAAQKHVGVFRGAFRVGWYVNNHGQIHYDDLMIDADGFKNNEFVGTWSPYGGTVSKPCNWGDYRIPMSGDLDAGEGEFFPSQKYINNGWASYRQAFGGANDSIAKEARINEAREWWK
jgi:hypothetical protein